MKILVAEDDLASRKFISKYLSKFGDVDVAEDGMQAVNIFANRMKEQEYFQLVCLDIMMPKVDGYKALQAIRDIEKKNGVTEDKRAKIVMTSALNETETPMNPSVSEHDGYATKPIDMDKFELMLNRLGLI